jgi:hypothetical protein
MNYAEGAGGLGDLPGRTGPTKSCETSLAVRHTLSVAGFDEVATGYAVVVA